MYKKLFNEHSQELMSNNVLSYLDILSKIQHPTFKIIILRLQTKSTFKCSGHIPMVN